MRLRIVLFTTVTSLFFPFPLPHGSLMYPNLASISLCKKDVLNFWSQKFPELELQACAGQNMFLSVGDGWRDSCKLYQPSYILNPLKVFLGRTLLMEKPRHKKILVLHRFDSKQPNRTLSTEATGGRYFSSKLRGKARKIAPYILLQIGLLDSRHEDWAESSVLWKLLISWAYVLVLIWACTKKNS